jgi:uncharacterized protein YecT (DUF1311 family)
VFLRQSLPSPAAFRPTALRCIAWFAAALLALSTAASAGDAPAADRAAIAACLDLVKKNEAARGAHESDELTEKPGPAGRLAAARVEAPRRKESCIGVVATACIQADGNESTATMNQCYGREADAWDARLNAAYKAALAQADGQDVADGLRKTQRTWIAFRDARCAQPALAFKGTMAGPMSVYCVMDLTARQSMWLEGWLN